MLISHRAHSSELEVKLLEWTVNSYETPHTITEDLSRTLNEPLTEVEVAAALIGMCERGLVRAYSHDPASEMYTPLELTSPDDEVGIAWFRATDAGTRKLRTTAAGALRRDEQEATSVR